MDDMRKFDGGIGPDRPEQVDQPGIELGLPFVETRIGRIARYAKYFDMDRDVVRADAYRSGLEEILLSHGVDELVSSEVAEALIQFAPIDCAMFSETDTD